MDIFTVLEKLNINKDYFQYFENGFILRPQMHQISNVLYFKFHLFKAIPSYVYKDLLNALEQQFQCKVELFIETDNVTYDTSHLIGYFNVFANILNYKPFESFIPFVFEDSLIIENKEIDLEKIKYVLNHFNIKYDVKYSEIVIENKKIENVKENVITNYKYENSINENEYLFVDIAHLLPSSQKIKTNGIVFKEEQTKIKSGRILQRIAITDYNEAISIKRWESKVCSIEELNKISNGQYITVYGKVEYDTYDRENVLMADKIEINTENPYERKDDWQGIKHIELRAHTKYSEMDGVSNVADIINQAYNFGSDAIAITDTGSVQAYPKMQEAHKKIDKANPDNNFKVIYGIDIKTTNDTLDIVYNPNNSKMYDNEYIVLDFETTGLSTRYDHIIEFGATYVSHGAVKNSIQMFIKPPIPINEFIQNKCNITDEMVADAKEFKDAAKDILEFIGDRVIVAHNAAFDYNFLNDQLVKYGFNPIKNPCIDTLNLARSLLADKKKYQLGTIAKNYNVDYNDEEAHRGDYDAEVLAKVWVRMMESIPNYKEITLNDLANMQPESVVKKAFPYNVTILAKNAKGIREIYELVTLSQTKYLNYYVKEGATKIDNDIYAEPRITKGEINKYRSNCFVGSGNMFSELIELGLTRNEETLSNAIDFFDYIELLPFSHYKQYIEPTSSRDEQLVRKVIRNIIELANKKGKLIVCNNDTSYTNPNEKLGHDVYITAKRVGGSRHPMYPKGKFDMHNFNSPDMHLMTTKEMFDAFDYLTEEQKQEYIIDNPKKIADQIEKVYPISSELFTPKIEGSEQELTKIVYENAYKKYGDPLPDIVKERIEKELNSVVSNGFTVQYYIAYLIVKKTNEDGYLVGSRGSVGSSFIATCANITEVNPLPPHYLCPKCHYNEFFTNHEVACGFDLPQKECPNCHTKLIRDGHNIPFETFLGFYGDKVPDIDLNFSEESQEKAMILIRDIFGEKNVFRAGTISTVAEKSTYGYIHNYEEETGKTFSKNFEEYISSICVDTKRTTGQHPGGIVVIPKENHVHDFTPIQYPANDPFSVWYTTHFAFKDLHDSILKLDILGHVDPYAVRQLQILTGVDPKSIDVSDPKVISLFYSSEALNIKDPKGYYNEKTGAAGLPEFGTRNGRNTLEITKPHSFSELVMISGLSHGTNVWAGNAKELILSGQCTLKDVIACRDDIMTFLISKGLEPKQSFDIMESVRKGRGLKPEWEENMRNHNVEEWYINSCKKIAYMFPKGHATAYVWMALRISWWKVYYPAAYYASFFTCRCDQYDIETLMQGEDAIYEKLSDIRKRKENKQPVSSKEEALETTYEIALEMYLRGYHFAPLSLDKSKAYEFSLEPNDDKAIIPSFKSIDGMGLNVGNSIVEARKNGPFLSKEDLIKRTILNNTQIQLLERLGLLKELDDTNQISLF